ncbi:phage helicase [Lacticaseibacillus rhamnosus MTCC 5462]|nr:phage helicase [Lacticaseibacillus rhamnosus MTCC 5462]
MGRHSKNGIGNELQDYSRWTNYFARVMTTVYMDADVNVLTTAWEDTREITSDTGQSFSQYAPLIRNSVRDGLLGLADVVGRVVINPKTNNRGVILAGSDAIFAKNRLDERTVSAIEDLFKFGVQAMFQLHPYQTKLVNQARQKLAAGSNSVLLVSPAGSGKSVIIAEIARLAVERGGHVMFMVHRQELVNQIVQTFQADEIDLRDTTIMTVGKIANRLVSLPRPTLIITDESHHSLAKTYRKIYDYYADIPRLGFSASPWRMNGKGLGDVYEAMVEGPSVKWLIEHHYLAPYDYYAPTLIDVQKLQMSSTGDYTNKSMDAAVPKAIFGDVVSHYRHLANGRQAIVYAHNIEASKQVVEAFRSAGISAVHADAKTPKAQREKIMRDFKAGDITVLSNVDLISEGFNVPDVGVIIMLRPTASLVLDIQQSMRGMRYKPGKRSIIIDHVANAYRFGLPDTEHHWSLHDRPKKKRRMRKDHQSKRAMHVLQSYQRNVEFVRFAVMNLKLSHQK